ncbi:hypothetical protein DAKH74_000020 [Maudiozyma humilis]|uniref:Uncharacterized protein n=1 Tax=Maudiozyma humilis TaxID=51915 RepID=A0AAV5RPD6_MAUHU|nr:hypothetical protein DAKH74_000020 [Kazachstania humilis]
MKLYDITLLCLSFSSIVFAEITTHEIGPTNFKPGLRARFYEAVIPAESGPWGNEDYFHDQEYIQDGNLLGQIEGIPTATVSYHRHYNDFVHGFYIDPDEEKQIVMELRGYFKLRQTEWGASKWVSPIINLCGKDVIRDTACLMRLHPDIGLYNVTSDTMCEFDSKHIWSMDYMYMGNYSEEGTASFQSYYKEDRWYPFMLAIVIGGDALEGEFQILSDGEFKALDPDQLMYNPDEDYPYFDDMRRTYNAADGLTALERCPHYDADNSLPPQIAPPYSTIEFSCSTSISSIVSSSETSLISSDPIVEPTSSDSIVEPTSSDPIVEPTSSDPIVEPTSSDPIVEPTSSDPIVEPTSSDPIVEPTSSDPIVEPTSSDPIVEPTSSDPIVEPTSSDPIVEPTSSDPIVEATSSDPIVEPTSSDPIVEPTSSDPIIEPTSSDLIVEPTSSDPMVETTSQKETSSTSKDPWYSQEPTDTLSYTTTTDEYVTTSETEKSDDFTASQTSTQSSADVVITSETTPATATDVKPTSSTMSEETLLSFTSGISTATVIETTTTTVVESTSSEFLTDVLSTPLEPDTTVHLPTTTTQFVTVTDSTKTVEGGANEETTNVQNASTSTIGKGEVSETEPLSTASDQSEGGNGPETIIPEPTRTTTVLEAVTQDPTGIDKSHQQTTTVLLPVANTNSAISSVHTTNHAVSDIIAHTTTTDKDAVTQSTSSLLLYSTVTTGKSDIPVSLEGFEGQASTYDAWTTMWAFVLAIAVL